MRMEQKKQLSKILIIGAVADLGLCMDDCRGQSYDARLLRHRRTNLKTKQNSFYSRKQYNSVA